VDSAGWDTRYGASDVVWGGEPNRFVAEEFTGIPPGRVLDLGAGEGRNAIWLAGMGWQVTAVDFSAVAVDRARRLAEQRGATVDWVLADLRAYQPPNLVPQLAPKPTNTTVAASTLHRARTINCPHWTNSLSLWCDGDVRAARSARRRRRVTAGSSVDGGAWVVVRRPGRSPRR
jgi:SAM-dependent methyltransferase